MTWNEWHTPKFPLTLHNPILDSWGAQILYHRVLIRSTMVGWCLNHQPPRQTLLGCQALFSIASAGTCKLDDTAFMAWVADVSTHILLDQWTTWTKNDKNHWWRKTSLWIGLNASGLGSTKIPIIQYPGRTTRQASRPERAALASARRIKTGKAAWDWPHILDMFAARMH